MLPKSRDHHNNTSFNVTRNFVHSLSKKDLQHLSGLYVSAADYHWPELHKLLPHATEPPTLSMRIQAIIDYPHITDWFFTTKLSDL